MKKMSLILLMILLVQGCTKEVEVKTTYCELDGGSIEMEFKSKEDKVVEYHIVFKTHIDDLTDEDLENMNDEEFMKQLMEEKEEYYDHQVEVIMTTSIDGLYMINEENSKWIKEDLSKESPLGRLAEFTDFLGENCR